MSVRFVRFPEIEDMKDRTMVEFAWLERQQSEELKKNQQSYIDFGALPDDIVKPAVLWAYYQGLSVSPKDRHLYFQQIKAENEDGEIENVALQPVIQYAGEIYLAVHGENARYKAVEMLIDGKRLGTATLDSAPFGLNSLLTIRVIDMANEERLLTKTVADCIKHGLEYSPTLAKFKKDLGRFWEGYQAYRNGNTSLFNPWYTSPLTMCAKTVWRQLDGSDKITSYSEEYLEEVRATAIKAQSLPDVRFDALSGGQDVMTSLPEPEAEVTKEVLPAPKEEPEQLTLSLTEGITETEVIVEGGLEI